MGQELTFAQALSEARQIIVQQSSRIKSDLEKIMSLQETIASQSTQISDHQRTLSEQANQLSEQSSQIESLSGKLEDMTTAREQAEAVIDRQGQRLTASQASIDQLEQKLSEQGQRISEMSSTIEGLRQQLPTAEDNEALAAFSSLLANKKSVPSLGKISQRSVGGSSSSRDSEDSSMRISPSSIAA